MSKRYDLILQSKLRSKGIRIPRRPKVLGRGSYGTVFALSKDKVIKVTTDEREAAGTKIIRKKRIPGVWYVEHIYHVPDRKHWIIIGERLTRSKARSYALLKELKSVMKLVKPKADFEHSQSYTKTVLRRLMSIGTKPELYRLAKALNGLREAGIDFGDLHYGNVMWKDGLPVLVDIRCWLRFPKQQLKKIPGAN